MRLNTRYILLISCLMACCWTYRADAQYSTIELKDGSVLQGYIASQRPGRDITIHSYHAEMFFSASSITDIEDITISYDRLPVGWKRYSINDNGIIQERLVLQDIQTPTKRHRFVKITEKGIKYKYIQHAEDSYIVRWEDIRKITKEKETGSALRLYDEIRTSDGNVYIGQITEQTPGDACKILLRNGDIQVIDAGDITITNKIPVNGNELDWFKRPYTNIIHTADGVEHKGLIISQYSNSNGDGYIRLLKQDQETEDIKYVEITEYIVKPYQHNYNYDRNNIYINDIPLKETEVLTGNGIVYFTDLTTNAIPRQEENIALTVTSGNSSDWRILYLEDVTLEDSRKAKGCYQEELKRQDSLKFTSKSDGTSLSPLSNIKSGHYIIGNESMDKYYIINFK